MIVIPALVVAISAAILTGVILFVNPKYINIKIFSLSTTLQLITYIVFSCVDLEMETKQFIVRSGLITSNLALSIIIIAGRHGR